MRISCAKQWLANLICGKVNNFTIVNYPGLAITYTGTHYFIWSQINNNTRRFTNTNSDIDLPKFRFPAVCGRTIVEIAFDLFDHDFRCNVSIPNSTSSISNYDDGTFTFVNNADTILTLLSAGFH